MSSDTKRQLRIFCGVGLAFMILTTPMVETKPGLGWIRIAYMILLATGLLSTFIFRTHKESK